MSPGLKPTSSPSSDARTKVRAYLRSKTTAVPIRQTLPSAVPQSGVSGRELAFARFSLARDGTGFKPAPESRSSNAALLQGLHVGGQRSGLVRGDRAHRLDVRGLGFATLGQNIDHALGGADELGRIHGRLALALVAVAHGALGLEQRGAILGEGGNAGQHGDGRENCGCDAEFHLCSSFLKWVKLQTLKQVQMRGSFTTTPASKLAGDPGSAFRMTTNSGRQQSSG